MAKASQVVLSENEFYLIKAPNGKVLEVKNFNTENGAAIRLWDYAGHPWQQWKFVDAGEGRWRIQNRFTGKMMDLALGGVLEWVQKEKVEQLPIWEGDKIFFKLLNEEHPWFSLKLVYEGDALRQAVLDGKRVV